MTTGAIPKVNVSGDLLSMSSKQPTKVREDLFRIDHNINDKWQLFGHYIGDSVSQTYATSNVERRFRPMPWTIGMFRIV